jgi:hypothetical protein
MKREVELRKEFTELTKWLQTIIELAKNDEDFSVAWFNNTKDEQFSIVAGWSRGFSKDYADLLYISTSDPEYAMCVKIVENERPYEEYVDFDLLNMPISLDGEVEDTCISIEQTDDLVALAEFLFTEWERLTDEYGA